MSVSFAIFNQMMSVPTNVSNTSQYELSQKSSQRFLCCFGFIDGRINFKRGAVDLDWVSVSKPGFLILTEDFRLTDVIDKKSTTYLSLSLYKINYRPEQQRVLNPQNITFNDDLFHVCFKK
jgi:hypothetical protein